MPFNLMSECIVQADVDGYVVNVNQVSGIFLKIQYLLDYGSAEDDWICIATRLHVCVIMNYRVYNIITKQITGELNAHITSIAFLWNMTLTLQIGIFDRPTTRTC